MAITDLERAALTWLLDGNGQKFISVGTPTGPHAERQATLVTAHRDLERKRFVIVGHGDYFGCRSCNITDAGRAALAGPSEGPET